MALDFNQQLLADLQAANMALINEISELRAEHKEEVQALNQQIAILTETLNQFKDRFFGAENSVRPYTLIRKNSLFHDTPKGATASAIICSLIETAKASNLDVLKYFEYVLTEMRGYNGQPEGMERFAPWTEQMQQLCGLKPINNG